MALPITLAADCSYSIRPDDHYYVRNVREELDSPGEWYLDRATATLYFWPPDGADLTTVFAPTLRTLLQLGAGTAHITFRGFVFEGAEGTAITFKDTTACRLVASTVRNVGDYSGNGISIDGGTANGVAYLNGSKVLTTGSALTFDGTKFGVASGNIDVVSPNFTGAPLISGRFNASNFRMGIGIGNNNGFPFLGVNVNNGMADLYSKITSLPQSKLSEVMAAATYPGSRRRRMGVVPACADCPVTVSSVHEMPCTPVTAPMTTPSSSSTGPCSMCSST